MVTVTMSRELSLLAFLFVIGIVWSESCNSCGSECQSACGTRHFRTCCFNYLRKRAAPAPPMAPSARLELWLARAGLAPDGAPLESEMADERRADAN